MSRLFIYDPSGRDKLGQHRGGGRMIQLLKENLPEAKLINDLHELPPVPLVHDREEVVTLLIPYFKPFEGPILSKRVADKQYILIYDVIPLKYPAHFPAGIRGNINLWKNKRALGLYDKIITISETAKKDIVRYLSIPVDKIEVVYPNLTKLFLTNLADSAGTNSDQLKPIPTKYALYVGDVNWNKNLVNLAHAIKLADVPCVFVGNPFSQETRNKIQETEVNHWLKEYQTFLKMANNDKRFIFLGRVEDKELIKLYQQAVVNILVSRDEGFGLSFLEAASQKTPSILANIPVFHEIARDNALFVDPNDSKAIAQTIKKLFENQKERDLWGSRAGQALDDYSPTKFRESFLKII